ncbi:MAG: exodeoxyribonuclease VII large subunit [Oligoflexia bacterium]|nr:exodeoxyribonuclease VII large subunit [Oligoflexia bacterium]
MPSEIEYISVSDLSRALNSALERQFPEVFFSGEVSQVTVARSGHMYLSIKDADSQVAAVMWAGLANGLGFDVQPGLAVLCHGRPNIYHASGKFQIVLHRMLLAGEGALRKRFLELRAKLEKEGLFAAQRKRPLPFLPRAIGIVTSGTGAVIHDITVRLKARMPCIPTFLVDVKVQGEGAAEDIASGLEYLDSTGLVDVIILARGGGSLEDLWAFNEERVVRAVFACRTPIVCGVGHEVDVTLADFAADVRAPTPTAAAEMVAPQRDELMTRIEEIERRLRDTDRWIQPLVQGLDEAQLRLQHHADACIERARLVLARDQARLQAIEPSRLLGNLTERVSAQQERLHLALRAAIERARSGLDRSQARLEAVNPKSVMQRGFAIVQKDGVLVRSGTQLEVGDNIAVSFAQGEIGAQVTKTIEKDKEEYGSQSSIVERSTR